MSFDYLSDIYGKYRINKETRFSNVESKAISLIKSFVDGAIDNRRFAKQFNDVRVEFLNLMKNDGEMVIDQDTPLWLNRFLGFHFVDWLKIQPYKWQIEVQAAAHPEQVTDEVRAIQQKIEAFEDRFVATCRSVLRELEK